MARWERVRKELRNNALSACAAAASLDECISISSRGFFLKDYA
jgi:hypothetical protein